ncbi:hypothetical protein PybrP1_000689 [[Pythium] brassicae (nom. inval.)]|nr:hypothetical protein PybrP1_000689 [[Pythium] brassicae (nom. inval.)]
MDKAATYGHLHVVKWLHEYRTEGCTTDAMDGTDSLQVLQWLHEHRREGCTGLATERAVYDGNFENLLFLEEKGLLRFSESVEFPVGMRLGFEIFQWIRTRWSDYESAWRRRPALLVEFCEWPMFVQFESGGGSSVSS